MQYMMKTPILVLLPSAFLFVIVLTQDNLTSNTTTTSCGVNEVPTNCYPCDKRCIGGPTICPLFCIQNFSYCACATDYSRISSTNTKCVPTKLCYLYAGKNSTINIDILTEN